MLVNHDTKRETNERETEREKEIIEKLRDLDYISNCTECLRVINTISLVHPMDLINLQQTFFQKQPMRIALMFSIIIVRRGLAIIGRSII